MVELIYSLGIIFYEMLTNERPYPGDSAIKIIVQHIQSPVPTLPQEFKEYQVLLNLMVAKNREDRFPDAGTVTDYIRELRVNKAQTRHVKNTLSDQSSAAENSETATGTFTRLTALISIAIILLAAFVGFYYWTESITKSSFARRMDVGFDVNTLNTGEANTKSSVSEAPQTQMKKEDVVKALQWLAQSRLNQDMLIAPPADNAHYYYSRLFPLNKELATKGFSDIAERFVVLAEKEFSDGNYRHAQTYVTLGLQVQPDNEGLLHLQSFIDNRDRSMLENMLNFLTGEG